MSAIHELLERCEAAKGIDNPDLARDLCKVFIDRDDYPTIGMMIANSLDGPERWQIGAAINLIEYILNLDIDITRCPRCGLKWGYNYRYHIGLPYRQIKDLYKDGKLFPIEGKRT